MKKRILKLFDFFANCEYFEEKFNYDEVLKLPQISHIVSSSDSTPNPGLDKYEHTGTDSVSLLTETKIGLEECELIGCFSKI